MSGNALVTVPEVYHETVEVGRQLGRPDSTAIGEWFEQSGTQLRDPHRLQKLEGVSGTDSRLLLLAEELGEAELLSNDRTLIRRAVERGLAARFSAELIHSLWETGKITGGRREGLLARFVDRGRYSQRFLQALFFGRG